MPYTPGPWTYAYEGSGSHNVYDMANDDLVAECGCDYGHDESYANGRLIAQAPAMYELLKELELSNHVSNGFYCCPVCAGEIEDKNRTRGICMSALGHLPDCRLAAVLKAVEGET